MQLVAAARVVAVIVLPSSFDHRGVSDDVDVDMLGDAVPTAPLLQHIIHYAELQDIECTHRHQQLGANTAAAASLAPYREMHTPGRSTQR